jgi:cell wall-associated NlpC family hydrolase
VRADVGAAIACRALDLVGVPFKLHGRRPEAGLDCVGVVALALAGCGHPVESPCDYTLRGDYVDRISAFLDRECFCRLSNEIMAAGDILLCRPAVRQLHLAIVTHVGAVHAHAGLRRVVLTPLPLPWPVIGHWRCSGD